MRIDNISLEHFGRRSQLTLDGLSDQLNIIFGPNGAGKSTVIQFLRWVLFGHTDEKSANYLRESSGRAAGAVGFVQDGRRRKIERRDDGSRQGWWAVDGESQPASVGTTGFMGSFTLQDFDLLFARDFENEPDLVSLLQIARSRGLELTSRREPTQRIQELRLRIDNVRREIERLPWIGQELALLVDHRSSLERRITQVEDDYRRRRASVDREYEELNRQIVDLETSISRLRDQWHVKDRDVNTRRVDLEEAWRSSDDARREFVNRLRNELSDLENNLDRARSMLAEFQRRATRLDGDLREREFEVSAHAYNKQENLCLMQSLARQLDELRSHPTTLVDAPVYRSQFGQAATVTTHTAALESLRHEVGRLCHVLQGDREEERVRALADEQVQLRQCEAEIERWTAKLVEQRNTVAKQLDEAERFGVSLVVDRPNSDMRADYNGYLPEVPASSRRVRAVLHACDGFQPIEPDADELLRRLTTERDIVSRDLDLAERQLRQLLDRRRELELHLHRVQDHEMGSLRREIAELDGRIRTAEERERLNREIERLEMELSRVGDDIVPSPIVAHAAEMLRDVSGGRLVDVRINDLLAVDGRGVLVHEVATQQMVPYAQLSRGLRDQVYFSLCLAMIAALRRQGLEMPLILNDPFINMDSDRGDAWANLLSGIARRGQQVLLFTRHRHVADWFRPHQARYIELEHIGPTGTAVRPAMDEVRFRSYADTTSMAPRRLDERGAVSFRRAAERNMSEYRPLPARPRDVEYRESYTNALAQPSWPHGSSWDSARAECLRGDVPLARTGTVEQQVASELATLGIVTVDDFLRSSPGYIERESQRRGLPAVRPLQRLRDELSLRCMLPGLGDRDARWLVSCGASSIQALAERPVDSLLDRTTGISRLDDRVSREQLERWVQYARQILAGTRERWSTEHTAFGSDDVSADVGRYRDWGNGRTWSDADRSNRSPSESATRRPYVWERYAEHPSGSSERSAHGPAASFGDPNELAFTAQPMRARTVSAEMPPSIGREQETRRNGVETFDERSTWDQDDREPTTLAQRSIPVVVYVHFQVKTFILVRALLVAPGRSRTIHSSPSYLNATRWRTAILLESRGRHR